MSAHCSLQQLSTYVDDELPPRERDVVDSHLSDCPRCRARLADLGSVVGALRRVERAAPPAELGYRVERTVARPRERPLWLVEESARRWLDPPRVAPLFGVVMALAVLFYLAAVYGDRARGRVDGPSSGTRLVIPAAETSARGAVVSPAGPESSVRWGDRSFHRRDEGWWEEGLGEEAPARVVDLTEPARELLASVDPVVLWPLAGRVRLRLGGEVVELYFPD